MRSLSLLTPQDIIKLMLCDPRMILERRIISDMQWTAKKTGNLIGLVVAFFHEHPEFSGVIPQVRRSTSPKVHKSEIVVNY